MCGTNQSPIRQLKSIQGGNGKKSFRFCQGTQHSKVDNSGGDGRRKSTLDTLIRIANALGVSLDELVFGTVSIEAAGKARCLLRQVEWYHFLPADKQEAFQYHFGEILKLL